MRNLWYEEADIENGTCRMLLSFYLEIQIKQQKTVTVMKS
jgi:hypothetical protein